MTAIEIIIDIEKAYNTSNLIYEKMFALFITLSGIGFHKVPVKKGSSIVRARYCNEKESFNYLSEMSYPQKQYVKNFSRLNRPYQNLFYGSETEATCISEMLPNWLDEFKIGDIITVTIGNWIVQKDFVLAIIPDLSNTNVFNKMILHDLNPEEIIIWEYISNKFKTNTKEDKNIYEFTAAFGNALRLKSEFQKIQINGFIYSSVQSKENINIAINTNLIDSKYFIPVDFTEIKFQKIGINEKGLPIYIQIGNSKMSKINFENNQIEWFK
ncbi:MAG: RES domain-containing protein [Bacteroidia bacterium]